MYKKHKINDVHGYSSEWLNRVLKWQLVTGNSICDCYAQIVIIYLYFIGIPRYLHFIHNHYSPGNYHDGDKVFCGFFFADTDIFIPYQLIHIFISLYAMYFLLNDNHMSKAGYILTIFSGIMNMTAAFHYLMEHVSFFSYLQHFLILSQTFSGFFITKWAAYEYHQYFYGDVPGDIDASKKIS